MPDGILISSTALHSALLRLRQMVQEEADNNAEDGCTAALAGLDMLTALLAPAAEKDAIPTPPTFPRLRELAPPPFEAPASPAPEPPPAEPTPTPRRTRNVRWSEERRAAQAERMHKLHEEGRCRGGIASPERLALLQAEWPKGTHVEELLPRLAALPGAPLTTVGQVQDMAVRANLRREVRPVRRTEKLTEARAGLLRQLWPDPALTVREIHQRINALPGEPFRSETTLYSAAMRLGMPPRPAKETAAATPAPPAAEAPAAPEAAPATPRKDPEAESQPMQTAAPVAPDTPARAANNDKATPERAELMRELWLDPSVHVRDIHARINALPGEPYTNPTSLYGLAVRLGLPTQRPIEARSAPVPPPQPAEPAPPPADPAIADAKLTETQGKARAMLMRGSEPAVVAMHTKLPLREVIRLQGEVREARRRAAADAEAAGA